ncbi:MAG TPA: hypothetical protein VNK03_04095 [Gammaproteobacteria bacterium]|nr:hypothetical protein [Gammaproteobacteria bacterium]
MRYLILGLLCVAISGCSKYAAPSTPKEEEAQKSRMRYHLEETSPRNSSGIAKVTPEFRKSFNLKTSSSKSEDAPTAKQPKDNLKSE